MADPGSRDEGLTGPTTSRRGFLAGTAGLTGLALAAGALQTAEAAAAAAQPAAPAGSSAKPGTPSPAQGATDARLVGTNFFLVLNGQNGFALQGVDGGVISGDVIAEPPGPDNIAKKHIGSVKYANIVLSSGIDQPSPLYDWMEATIRGKAPTLDGTVIGTTSNGTGQARLDWHNALLSEIGFPALDAASKDAAKLTFKVVPEKVEAGNEGRTVSPPNKVQKNWLPSNFRLKIDGLEDACAGVNKIEAIVVKQRVEQSSAGTPPTVSVDIPNLIITLPAAVAQPFIDWHTSFVIQGGNNAANPDNGERNGTLVYFATDGTQLGQLTFSNLGIVQVADDPSSTSIRRVKAEMYCEHMDFVASPGF